MDKVRFGIIGLGNMGGLHLTWINEIPEVELTAVCDIDAEKADRKAKEYNVRSFHSADELFASGCVDAVLIAVPHYSHTPLAIEAFKHGLHVLCEKPFAVTKSDAQKMIDEHAKHPELRFGLMFQQRTHAAHKKIKKLIDSGEFGRIQRVNWIITDWYRNQSYYDAAGWKATWDGEGGGVLLNQCPHQLDLLQWLCGMPVKVRAFCHEGKWHDIEVEDDVTAYMEFENGATGVFVTTTADAPGTNRLELTFEMGKIVCEEGRLFFDKLSTNVSDFCKTEKEGFKKPEYSRIEIETDGQNEQHIGVLKAFAGHILRGTPLVAEGTEGIRGLTLSNAMHLSSWLDRTVELPLDEELFLRELNKKRATSRKKEDTDIVFDTTGTY